MIPIWLNVLYDSLSAYPPMSDLRSNICSSSWLHKLISVFAAPLTTPSLQSSLPCCQEATCTTLCFTNHPHVQRWAPLGSIAQGTQEYFPLLNTPGGRLWHMTAKVDKKSSTSTCHDALSTWVKTSFLDRHCCLLLVFRPRTRHA